MRFQIKINQFKSTRIWIIHFLKNVLKSGMLSKVFPRSNSQTIFRKVKSNVMVSSIALFSCNLLLEGIFI